MVYNKHHIQFLHSKLCYQHPEHPTSSFIESGLVHFGHVPSSLSRHCYLSINLAITITIRFVDKAYPQKCNRDEPIVNNNTNEYYNNTTNNIDINKQHPKTKHLRWFVISFLNFLFTMSLRLRKDKMDIMVLCMLIHVGNIMYLKAVDTIGNYSK